MKKNQSYKDLKIYQISHKLAVQIHKITLSKLPKFEQYEEGIQIRRSSKAIPTNIVEGFGRKRYRNEYIRYLTIALASCDETKEHLTLLHETESLQNEDTYNNLMKEYEELGSKIFRFRESLEK